MFSSSAISPLQRGPLSDTLRVLRNGKNRAASKLLGEDPASHLSKQAEAIALLQEKQMQDRKNVIAASRLKSPKVKSSLIYTPFTSETARSLHVGQLVHINYVEGSSQGVVFKIDGDKVTINFGSGVFVDLDNEDEISSEPFVERLQIRLIMYGLEPVNSDNRFAPGGNGGKRPPPGTENCFYLEPDLLVYIRGGGMVADSIYNHIVSVMSLELAGVLRPGDVVLWRNASYVAVTATERNVQGKGVSIKDATSMVVKQINELPLLSNAITVVLIAFGVDKSRLKFPSNFVTNSAGVHINHNSRILVTTIPHPMMWCQKSQLLSLIVKIKAIFSLIGIDTLHFKLDQTLAGYRGKPKGLWVSYLYGDARKQAVKRRAVVKHGRRKGQLVLDYPELGVASNAKQRKDPVKFRNDRSKGGAFICYLRSALPLSHTHSLTLSLAHSLTYPLRHALTFHGCCKGYCIHKTRRRPFTRSRLSPPLDWHATMSL